MSARRVSERVKTQTEFTGNLVSSEHNIGFDLDDVLGEGDLSTADIKKLEARYNKDGTSKKRTPASAYDKNAPKPRTVATGGVAGGAAGEIADAAVGAPVKVEESADDPQTDMPHHTAGSPCVFVDDEGERWHAFVKQVNTSAEDRSITIGIEGCDQIILVPQDKWKKQIKVDTLFLTLRKWQNADAAHGIRVKIVCDVGYDPQEESRRKIRRAKATQSTVIADDLAKLKEKWDREGIVYDRHSAIEFAMETQGLNKDAIDVEAQLHALKETCSWAKYRDHIIRHAKEVIAVDGFFCADDFVSKMEIEANVPAHTLSDNESFLDYLVEVLINCHRVHHDIDKEIYDRFQREIARGNKSQWQLGVAKAHKEEQKRKEKCALGHSYARGLWLISPDAMAHLLCLEKKRTAKAAKAVNTVNAVNAAMASAVSDGTNPKADVPAEVYAPFNTPFATTHNTMGIRTELVLLADYIAKKLAVTEEQVKENPWDYLGIHPNASNEHADQYIRVQLHVLKNNGGKYNLSGVTKQQCSDIINRLKVARSELGERWQRQVQEWNKVDPASKEGKFEETLRKEEIQERIQSMKPCRKALERRKKQRRQKQSAKTHVAMVNIKQEIKQDQDTGVKEENDAPSTNKKRHGSRSPTESGMSPVKQEKNVSFLKIPKKQRCNGAVGK